MPLDQCHAPIEVNLDRIAIPQKHERRSHGLRPMARFSFAVEIVLSLPQRQGDVLGIHGAGVDLRDPQSREAPHGFKHRRLGGHNIGMPLSHVGRPP